MIKRRSNRTCSQFSIRSFSWARIFNVEFYRNSVFGQILAILCNLELMKSFKAILTKAHQASLFLTWLFRYRLKSTCQIWAQTKASILSIDKSLNTQNFPNHLSSKYFCANLQECCRIWLNPKNSRHAPRWYAFHWLCRENKTTDPRDKFCASIYPFQSQSLSVECHHARILFHAKARFALTFEARPSGRF